MIVYTESWVVYNQIKSKSGLNDEALALLGVTQAKINEAIHQCVKKGMSRKQAAKTVLNLWKQASPDVQSKPATAQEMTIMGFYKTPEGRWKHNTVALEIDEQLAKTLSFRDVERMVFEQSAKQQREG